MCRELTNGRKLALKKMGFSKPVEAKIEEIWKEQEDEDEVTTDEELFWFFQIASLMGAMLLYAGNTSFFKEQRLILDFIGLMFCWVVIALKLILIVTSIAVILSSKGPKFSLRDVPLLYLWRQTTYFRICGDIFSGLILVAVLSSCDHTTTFSVFANSFFLLGIARAFSTKRIVEDIEALEIEVEKNNKVQQ